MLLLHVTDIHFRAPTCATPDGDPTRPIRTRLLQDVRDRVQHLGPVDAILVSGDIAFCGHPDEYAAALSWLAELSEASGCQLARIFVVPGNHDVDRNIAKLPETSNAQQAIRSANDREHAFQTQFQNTSTRTALLAPLAAYNDFAKNFGCQILSPTRPTWIQELPLTADVKLRIHGLTSTLLSGQDGKDDKRLDLYLSPLQTVLDPLPNVVNAVLCHHPPDWFIDMDQVEDALTTRAHLHFFGHKHRQRVQPGQSHIRFDGGAVNPNRNEQDWRPGYNFVSVDVDGSGLDRVLVVKGHLLEYQTNPELFRLVQQQNGKQLIEHRISIPSNNHAVKPSSGGRSAETTKVTPDPNIEAEAAMGQEHTRELILRFWKLTSNQRRTVVESLDLLHDVDPASPELQRYSQALLNASKAGLIDKLAEKITELEKKP